MGQRPRPEVLSTLEEADQAAFGTGGKRDMLKYPAGASHGGEGRGRGKPPLEPGESKVHPTPIYQSLGHTHVQKLLQAGACLCLYAR